jgi:hypothetical protein
MKPSKKTVFMLNFIIFGLIALVHLIRLLLGWRITANEVALPLWLSVVGVVLAGILAGLNYIYFVQK